MSPLRVLVVDDDEAMRTMLASFLGSKGCAVVEASGPESAAAAVRESRPDAITLDFEMGRYTDGSDFRSELLKSRETASIPIVVYSGADETSVRAAFKFSERLRFVSKPGNLEGLWGAIEAMTRRSGAL